MGRWVLLAAVFMPLAAQAGTVPDRTSSAAAPRPYAVKAPSAHGYIPEGWAVRATFKGRAMDLQSRDWSEDPHVQPNDVEAGYGWRAGRTSALIGYESHDFGPRESNNFGVSSRATARALERDPNLPPPVSGQGVLGFSLVLHGR
jgi:hypothetical protein